MTRHPGDQPIAAASVLNRNFLEMRHELVNLAAALDRIDRGGEAAGVRLDPRMIKLLEAARLLTDGLPDRAKRVQMLFSEPHDPNWRAD